MKDLICIVCPRGCHLHIDDNNQVSGNTCPRGAKYAIEEITCPKRMLTSTVKVIDGELSRLPVITSDSIPKSKIFNIMNELHKKNVYAPIHVGDIIVENILGLGVNIVATRNIEKR